MQLACTDIYLIIIRVISLEWIRFAVRSAFQTKCSILCCHFNRLISVTVWTLYRVKIIWWIITIQWRLNILTLISIIPHPQHLHSITPSGEAPINGFSTLMKSPHSLTSRLSWSGVNFSSYLAIADFSCLQPHLVAFVENLNKSGWLILIMRLIDGLAGFVWQAALNFDAVMRPALIWNHKRLFACVLVLSSTALHSSGVTLIFKLIAFWSSS